MLLSSLECFYLTSGLPFFSNCGIYFVAWELELWGSLSIVVTSYYKLRGLKQPISVISVAWGECEHMKRGYLLGVSQGCAQDAFQLGLCSSEALIGKHHLHTLLCCWQTSFPYSCGTDLCGLLTIVFVGSFRPSKFPVSCQGLLQHSCLFVC